MTLQNTIRDLIYKFWNLDDLSVDEVVPFFVTLINCGCDFFELANELSRIAIPIPFDLMYAVCCLCPKAIKIRDIKTQTIRGLIPR